MCTQIIQCIQFEEKGIEHNGGDVLKLFVRGVSTWATAMSHFSDRNTRLLGVHAFELDRVNISAR